KPLGEERECLVERRQVRREATNRVECLAADASARRPVTDLAQIVRVREHERAVRERQDVELEHVAAELDRELERAQRVLRCQRRCAPVADARELAGAATKLDHATRLMTTTAQSSASTLFAKSRQSASTVSARSCADSSRPA